MLAALAVKPTGQRQCVSQGLRQRLAGLALDVANHAAQPAPQFPELASHPSVPCRVRVAPRLQLGTRADSRAALTQLDAVRLGLVNELFGALFSSRLSVGCEIAFSCTVVSTTIVHRFAALIVPIRLAASIVPVNGHSAPSSPMRFRQRTRLDGSHGSSCRKYRSPQKHWWQGFWTQRSTTCSSLSA